MTILSASGPDSGLAQWDCQVLYDASLSTSVLHQLEHDLIGLMERSRGLKVRARLWLVEMPMERGPSRLVAVADDPDGVLLQHRADVAAQDGSWLSGSSTFKDHSGGAARSWLVVMGEGRLSTTTALDQVERLCSGGTHVCAAHVGSGEVWYSHVRTNERFFGWSVDLGESAGAVPSFRAPVDWMLGTIQGRVRPAARNLEVPPRTEREWSPGPARSKEKLNDRPSIPLSREPVRPSQSVSASPNLDRGIAAMVESTADLQDVREVVPTIADPNGDPEPPMSVEGSPGSPEARTRWAAFMTRFRRSDDPSEGGQAQSVREGEAAATIGSGDTGAARAGSSQELRDEDAMEAADRPAVSDDPVLAEVPRTANGNIPVGEQSRSNATAWHAPEWTKIPALLDEGPGRDIEVQFGVAQDLRVMAGSVRGTRHQFYAQPNQDAFAIARTDRFLVVAVADGVGSARFAAHGSAYVSERVVRYLESALRDTAVDDADGLESSVRQALHTGSEGVMNWSEGAFRAPHVPAVEVRRSEVSTTLTVCIVPLVADLSGSRTVTCANVGDSPCYTLRREGWRLETEATKDGAVLDLATVALPCPPGEPIPSRVRQLNLGPDDVLVVMTDGIGQSLASGQTEVGSWLAGRLRRPMLAHDWIDTLMFDRAGEDDDRTMVAVWAGSSMADAGRREPSGTSDVG